MKHSALATGSGQARHMSRAPKRSHQDESWVSLLARTVEQRRKAPGTEAQAHGGNRHPR